MTSPTANEHGSRPPGEWCWCDNAPAGQDPHNCAEDHGTRPACQADGGHVHPAAPLPRRSTAAYNAMAEQHDGQPPPPPASHRYKVAQEVHDGVQHLVIKGTTDHVPLDEVAAAYNAMVDQLAGPTVECNGTPVATASSALLAMDIARTMSWKRTGTRWSVRLGDSPATGADYRAGQQLGRPAIISDADLGAADVVITDAGNVLKSRWDVLVGARIVVVPSKP